MQVNGMDLVSAVKPDEPAKRRFAGLSFFQEGRNGSVLLR
jgi:hypothetical protein